MSKLTSKIALPIITSGVFAIFALIAFMASNYQKLDVSFYVIILLIFIYMFFFGLATGQKFSSPIKKLLERAEEVSKGNFSSRVYLETKDEISELGNVFNKIAEKLEASHQQEESLEKSVDLKVKAKTQELEETINALEQKVRNRTAELEKLLKETGQKK